MRIDEHENRLQELEHDKTRVMEIKSAKEENAKVRGEMTARVRMCVCFICVCVHIN